MPVSQSRRSVPSPPGLITFKTIRALKNISVSTVVIIELYIDCWVLSPVIFPLTRSPPQSTAPSHTRTGLLINYLKHSQDHDYMKCLGCEPKWTPNKLQPCWCPAWWRWQQIAWRCLARHWENRNIQFCHSPHWTTSHRRSTAGWTEFRWDRGSYTWSALQFHHQHRCGRLQKMKMRLLQRTTCFMLFHWGWELCVMFQHFSTSMPGAYIIYTV